GRDRRAAPAERSLGRWLADAQRAAGGRARSGGRYEQGDRPDAVRHREDGGDPPRAGVPQARRLLAAATTRGPRARSFCCSVGGRVIEPRSHWSRTGLGWPLLVGAVPAALPGCFERDGLGGGRRGASDGSCPAE